MNLVHFTILQFHRILTATFRTYYYDLYQSHPVTRSHPVKIESSEINAVTGREFSVGELAIWGIRCMVEFPWPDLPYGEKMYGEFSVAELAMW